MDPLIARITAELDVAVDSGEIAAWKLGHEALDAFGNLAVHIHVFLPPEPNYIEVNLNLTDPSC